MSATARTTQGHRLRAEVVPILERLAEACDRTATDVLSAALLVAEEHRAEVQAKLATMPGRAPQGTGRKKKHTGPTKLLT